MPAPQTFQEYHPTFAHVNLMVDSLLANADLDDLRAIIRTTLASCPPSTANVFTAAARRRLGHISAKPLPSNLSLFATSSDGLAAPMQSLDSILRRSRALYGAGMGFASLRLLSEVVRSSIGLRWQIDDAMADTLAAVDADISQGIQSAKEELGGGRVADLGSARMAVNELGSLVRESLRDCEMWGGEFPFERALASIEYWKF